MIIDQEGVNEINTKIKNPLNAMWEEIQKSGLQTKCGEHYNFVFRFLDEINNNWARTENPDPSVIVNGKVYKSEN